MGRDEYGRYNYDNHKNNNRAIRASYSPTPSAPTLDITINTQQTPSPSPVAYNKFRAPQPPPPAYEEHMHERLWMDRFARREDRGMFRLALVEALLAVVIISAGVWCLRDTSDYCPYHSAIWSGVFYLINAIIGCMAAKSGAHNLYMAHLILSMCSVMMCAISGSLSARNWTLVGTYHHPKIERDMAFCLLGQHDAARINYISRHMDQYNFPKCLFELKIGVAVNSIEIVVAAIQAFLNILSAIFSCRRTCTSCISA